MVTLAIATFVGALALPAMGIVGAGFVPEMDDVRVSDRHRDASRIEPRLHAAEGAGSRRASSRKRPEVAYTYTTVGGQGDAVDEGIVFVKLMPKTERSRSQADGRRGRPFGRSTKLAWRQRRRSAPGFNPGRKADSAAGARDRREGADAPGAGGRRRAAQVPGAVDVALSTKGQKPELDVQLDRGLAGSLGVTVGEVAQALRPAFAGIDVGDWIDPSGETRDVTIRLAPESRTVGRRSRVAAAAGRRTGQPEREHSSRTGGARSRRRSVRRASITSIASA